MILQPPTYVPLAIAIAAETITHVGGRVKSALRCPEATSASEMIPIVFCASFAPWVKATKPPETQLEPTEDVVHLGGCPPAR